MDTRYRLTLSLSVTDASDLWAAAAALAMGSPDMTMDDVVETLGSIDAPQIEDCLAMLIQPDRFWGCEVEDLAICVVESGDSAKADGNPKSIDLDVGWIEARRDRFAFQTS